MVRDKNRLTYWLSAIVAVGLIAALLVFAPARPAWAELVAGSLEEESVAYLPDVTEDMMHASYWSNKQADPTAVLANRAQINGLNQAGVVAKDTMLQPLKTSNERYFTKEEQEKLKKSTESDLAYFVGEKAQDVDGNVLTEEMAAEIAKNCPTDGEAPSIASGYAIVTTHTTARNLPTDRMMGLTPGDVDDDNLYLSMLRVNEPLLVRAQSFDKKFFLCTTSCLVAGWVPAKDIAICKNRAEWLSAWNVPAGQELVVTGYKVRTEQSRQTPNTADRMLYMGTVLERYDLDSPEQALEIVGTRSAYNRHVCFLPVRDANGNYSKELALIAESADVSEGYLPLTKEKIAEQAFKSLGQMYGWGGMLEANDCSGYVRDVYKCFGLELARNTTWQMNMPVRGYDLSGLDDAHKAAAIAQMPLGTVLFWGSHEMIYLGQENGKLYVISSLGSIGDVYGEATVSYQVKGVSVNTLDMVRGNRNTWLRSLTYANIPSTPSSEQGSGLSDISFYEDGFSWPEATYTYTGKAIAPAVKLAGLEEGTDYTVAFKNNVEIGTATVTVTGKGSYSGAVSRTFEIVSADYGKTSIDSARVDVRKRTYTGEALVPKLIVSLDSTLLTEGVDYDVSCANNVNAGTATVTITGKGDYAGKKDVTFVISRAAISKASVTVASKAYTGKKLKPAPTVKMGSTKLVRNVDYTVSYIDNKAVGTALVKVKGKGNYAGTTYATFTIDKASQSIQAQNVSKTVKVSAKTQKLAKSKTFNLKTLAKVSAKTKVRFAKANQAGGKSIVVNASSGNVTVKKGLKAGTYRVKVKLAAKASASYKAAKSKSITFKVVLA